MKSFIMMIIATAIVANTFRCDPIEEKEVNIVLGQKGLENEKELVIQKLNELNSAIDDQQTHVEMNTRTNSRINANIKNVLERLLHQKEVIRISRYAVINSSEANWDEVSYDVKGNITSIKIEFLRAREKIRNEIDTNNLIK